MNSTSRLQLLFNIHLIFPLIQTKYNSTGGMGMTGRQKESL